jgi:hypothetical protein
MQLSLPSTNAKRFAQGSVSDEAIHLPASGAMDCFALLAMTKMASRVRPIDPTGKSLLIFRNHVKPKNQKYFA